MSLVSQSIKNLKGGISQQPDILRYPEQGAAQVNGWSSETEGLQKRPPIIFNKVLGDHGMLGDKPLIHLINRDEYEQYYAVFTGSDVLVFDMDGNQYEVRGSREYINTPTPRDTLRMVTVADYTFIINRGVVVGLDPELSQGGAFRVQGDAMINVRGGQYGRTLKVFVNDAEVAVLVLPDGTDAAKSHETDAQWIAGQLRIKINEKLGPQGWTINEGTGYVHIIAPAGDSVRTLQTVDGYADQLISPVTHYAQSFSKLPLNAPDGYMVKIVGDAASSADQYYVRYNKEKKVWEETLGWNSAFGWNDRSMPWTLIRAADGKFDLVPQDWTERKSGDDDTNPYPSILGSTINDVFFFRNRLGFLSGENIVMSRTSSYFNLFPASVAVLSDDDPIDVAVSFNRVSILKYAVPFAEELLLWSDQAQFVLTSAGALTAKSVELNLTTQFDVQEKARPFGIGRGIFFASQRANFTSVNRYYAVQDVSSVKSSEDMTSHVSSYIPNGVFSFGGTSSENYCSVLTEGAKNKVFMFKFKYLEEQLRQQSWSHWELTPDMTIYVASTIGSRINFLISNGRSVMSAYADFTKSTIDLPGEPYRLFMDYKKEYVIPGRTYNDATYETVITVPMVYGMAFNTGPFIVVEMSGKAHIFDTPEGGWADHPEVRLPGNLEGAKVYVGFNYHFLYEFSKFLIKKQMDDGTVQTEDIGRLQLRRAWVNYEESGTFTIEVNNQGREYTYVMAGGRLGSDQLRVGKLNVGTGQYKFPVHGNATQNTVKITSEAPTPLNVIGCGWEGNYIRRSTGI